MGLRMIEQLSPILHPEEKLKANELVIAGVVRTVYITCAQVNGYKKNAPRQQIVDMFEGILRLFLTMKSIEKIKPASFIASFYSSSSSSSSTTSSASSSNRASVVIENETQQKSESGEEGAEGTEGTEGSASIPLPPPIEGFLSTMTTTSSSEQDENEKNKESEEEEPLDDSESASSSGSSEGEESLFCAIFDACKLLMEKIVERACPTLVQVATDDSSATLSPHKKQHQQRVLSPSVANAKGSPQKLAHKSMVLWLMFGCKFVNKALEMMGPERADDERVLSLIESLQHIEVALPDL